MARGHTNLAVLSAVIGLVWASCSSDSHLTEHQKIGKRMYEGLCGRCHKLIDPTSKDDQTWTAAAQKYGAQLRLRPEEISPIQDYLTRANDKDTKD